MPWSDWIVIGSILICVELFAISAAFYLVFLGVAAVIVGLVGLAGLNIPSWAQWLLFSTLSIICMLTFRRTLYDQIRNSAPTAVDTIVGDRLALQQTLRPGKCSRADYRGTTWKVVNVGRDSIPRGCKAVVVAVSGLTLRIHKPNSDKEENNHV